MKKFKITWETVVYKSMEVEAENETEAILMAENEQGFVTEEDIYDHNYSAEELEEFEDAEEAEDGDGE